MAITKLYNKTGDEKACKIQEDIESMFGFLPEVFQAMGRNGDFLEAAMKMSEAAGKGLDNKTKELISIAVSVVNGCDYCVEAHTTLAKRAGITDEEITAAIEIAALMSAFNNFNKAIGLKNDITSK